MLARFFSCVFIWLLTVTACTWCEVFRDFSYVGATDAVGAADAATSVPLLLLLLILALVKVVIPDIGGNVACKMYCGGPRIIFAWHLVTLDRKAGTFVSSSVNKAKIIALLTVQGNPNLLEPNRH